MTSAPLNVPAGFISLRFDNVGKEVLVRVSTIGGITPLDIRGTAGPPPKTRIYMLNDLTFDVLDTIDEVVEKIRLAGEEIR